MLALVQHNYKKLLGYHAVSQVGYMVTGIGLGSPIGIAGGLFHMINNALYKSGLFLAAGAVEKQTNEEELHKVGGLASAMPITFISALICALSISGVPPFNGFVSKWTIYQGIIDLGKGNSLAAKFWFVWLSAAVLGSALTLASFIKFISGIYLGRKKAKFKETKEVSFLMWVPQIVIAILCIVFGIFGTYYVLPHLIKPISGEFAFIGLWKSQVLGVLVIVGLIVGLIIYLIGNIKNLKVKRQFIGGEIINEEMQYPSVEFYKTILDIKILGWVYQKVKEKYFDIYDLGKKTIFFFSQIFSKMHTGVLTLYIIWAIIGLGLIMIILL
jgi:formate hydrogenlyase subunit 3/multisubunit Na+/H+ antiporter MnhD subunit